MAVGNSHLDDPLSSEAIVLIDEVELHLHPSWQQRILGDLRRTFPNAQFVVSTHSPQVLTTVKPEHVVELARENGRIVAGSAAGWDYGAEAGDVLSAVMGVSERPVNDFTEMLALYRSLLRDDQGESDEALALRQELDKRSPDDPALGRRIWRFGGVKRSARWASRREAHSRIDRTSAQSRGLSGCRNAEAELGRVS